MTRGNTCVRISNDYFAIGPLKFSQPVSYNFGELHDALLKLCIAEADTEEPTVPYWSRQFDYERQDFQDEDADQVGPMSPASAHDTPDTGPVLGANVGIAKAIEMALSSLPASPESSRQVASLVPATWEARNGSTPGTISLASTSASPASTPPPVVPTSNESVPTTPPAHVNAESNQKADHHEAGLVAAEVSVISVPSGGLSGTVPCPDSRPQATHRGRKRAAATVSVDARCSKHSQTQRKRKGQAPANLVLSEKRDRKKK